MVHNLPPTVGMDVYYISRGSLDGVYPPTLRAAKITAIHDHNLAADNTVASLIVFNPEGLFFNMAPHGTGPGEWIYLWEAGDWENNQQRPED